MKIAANRFPAAEKVIGGTKWGYINETGTFEIAAAFDSAKPYQPNGLAIVSLHNAFGLIDSTGKFIVTPKYELINDFSEGRAVVQRSGQRSGFKLIDEEGLEITAKAYDYIWTMQDGRAMFQEQQSYGFMDRDGKEAITVIYSSGESFVNGMAIVKSKDNVFLLIDHWGKVLHSFPYKYIANFSEGLLTYSEKEWFDADRSLGYINEQGNIVVPSKFKYAEGFKNGRAIVGMSENFSTNASEGLIDKKGRFVVEPKYQDVKQLGSSRIALGKLKSAESPEKGTIDALGTTDGQILTAPLYLLNSQFDNGYASASNENETFFIDLQGRIAKNLPILKGSGVMAFNGPLISALVD